jgi:hypothetical protein
LILDNEFTFTALEQAILSGGWEEIGGISAVAALNTCEADVS